MAIQFSMSPWLKMNRKRALYATLITWGFSLIMALPLLVVNQVKRIKWREGDFSKIFIFLVRKFIRRC